MSELKGETSSETPVETDRRPTMWTGDFERNLKLLFKVFKDKYNLVLDAEINLPRVISGKESFYYVLFLKVEGDKVLPLLRMIKELDEDISKNALYYDAFEATLKLLTSDATIKEIYDKAVSSEQPAPEGKSDVDIQEPLGSKDVVDSPKVTGEGLGGDEKETKSKK